MVAELKYFGNIILTEILIEIKGRRHPREFLEWNCVLDPWKQDKQNIQLTGEKTIK
jgi:hypothetical protein